MDLDKVTRAKAVLGTSPLTDTVAGALTALQRRRDLVALLFESDELDLGDTDVMSTAWR